MSIRIIDCPWCQDGTITAECVTEFLRLDGCLDYEYMRRETIKSIQSTCYCSEIHENKDYLKSLFFSVDHHLDKTDINEQE